MSYTISKMNLTLFLKNKNKSKHNLILFSLYFLKIQITRSPLEGSQPCAGIWSLNFITLMKRKQFSSIYNNILVCRGSAHETLLSQVNTPGVSDGERVGYL